ASRRSSPPDETGSGARAPLAARVSSVPTFGSPAPAFSLKNIAKKAGAVGQRTDSKDLGNRLAKIRESRTGPDVHAGANRRPRQKHWHVLACVIRARCGGIVAVVRRDDEQVAIVKAWQ